MEKIGIRKVDDAPEYTPDPESNPQVEPFRGDSTSIARWIRRGVHYRCVVVGCAMALSSSDKLIAQEGSRLKHRGPVLRCVIDIVRLSPSGVAYCRCDVCAFASTRWSSVEGRKKSKHAAGPGGITLCGHPNTATPSSGEPECWLRAPPPAVHGAARGRVRLPRAPRPQPCRDLMRNSSLF